MNHLIKEVCKHCCRNVSVGHALVQCSNCNCPVHHKCYKTTNIDDSGDFFCDECVVHVIKRYNPFKYEVLDDDTDPNDTINKLSNILNSCNMHSTTSVNESLGKHSEDAPLSLLFENIDGNKSNFDTLCVDLYRYSPKFSIIALAETNSGPELSDLYKIDEYKSFYQSTRQNKKKGSGVALYVHDSINATIDTSLSQVSENLETLFIKISNSTSTSTVGVLYRPPSGNIVAALDELSCILKNAPPRAYIAGDFNVNLHNPNSNVIEQYEQAVFSQGFYPLISVMTHEQPGCTPSCIDNIITNDLDNVISSGVIKDKITHHHPVFALLNAKLEPNKCKIEYKQYYDYCNSNVENFTQVLADRIRNTVISDFDSFADVYEDTVDKCFKLDTPKCSKRTMQNNPWITPGLIISINHCNQLYENWIKARKVKCKLGEICTKGGMCQCSSCHRKRTAYVTYKDFRKGRKKVVEAAQATYNKRKFAEVEGDSKKTWQLINKIRGKGKRTIKPAFIINDQKIINRRTIANEFNKYFVSLAPKLNESYSTLGEVLVQPVRTFLDYLPKPNMGSIYLHDSTPEEVSKHILELKNGKASDIPVHVIKKSSCIISPILSALFNECMCNGEFPDRLKVGKISPIYKKENEELLENYRPVSTLPIFGKLFEKIIYSRLYSFLSSQGILFENQFGFRKHHSTNHALNYSVDYVNSQLKEKHHVLGIFVDLSKAFDTISHDKLLTKLENYGIRGNANKLIGSYLSNRRQYVSVLGEESEKLSVLVGVPQGSVLGPLLFIVYINDISSCSDLGKFVLFADDTNIFVIDKSIKNLYRKANKIMKSIYEYMKCNLLHIYTPYMAI